ncbi:MAG TPA: HAMP domain-containing sensor histidine kinase, partial [Spirochaetia bacterium]
AKLLRAERLSVLGRFSSLILHDIRNPISILRSYAEMALLHPADGDLVERNIRRIIDEADRLNRIAGELLDFSRGEISLSMSIVNLRELVEKAVGIMAERFTSRRIEVRTEIAFEGPVILDADRMLRVLLNLADNSRKAMPKGGTFTIAVTKGEKQVLFEVSDTGEGMEPEVQERLFEPFYTSSMEGGTGLGMLIVKGIVDAHNGSLSFVSARGSGTTFRIALPLPS